MPLIAGAVALLVLAIVIVFGGVLGAVFASNESRLCSVGRAESVSDIPPDYLTLYQQAGARYGVPWSVLAAIGKTESEHGRSHDTGVHSGANALGAMGPMQFLASTWDTYGVDADGDGNKDVYDPADAIFTAANLLKADGAAKHLDAAIFDYNHAGWYVAKVRALATQYAGGLAPETVSSIAAGCATSALAPNAVAAQVITFARAQLGKPYIWGAAGPGAFDCSGLTMAAYRQVGISLPHNAADQWKMLPHIPPAQAEPGDLVFFEPQADGPGHVGIYIGGGQMIEAPNHTAPVRTSSVDRPGLVGYARPIGGRAQR